MSREIMTRQPLPAAERISYGLDRNQFFDIFLPEGRPKGAAIHIHGGFWRSKFDLSHASHLCTALAQAGFVCASLEYRRTGETGGGWPATFQDVAAGFGAARQHLHNYGRPVIFGHSAGGHLALLLAANFRDIRGVVSLAGVSCLELAFEENLGSGAVREFMGGTPADVPEFYAAADPSRHASAVRRVLLHGGDDDIVPPLVSRTFQQKRCNDIGPITLTEIQGADHFDLIDPASPAWPQVLACADAMLQDSGA